MSTDAKTIYTDALTATRAAEQQGLQQLESQQSRLTDYPDYLALVQQQIKVTQGQVERIEHAMGDAGTSPSTVKEAFTSTVGAIGAAVHGTFGDSVLKDLYAGYAYQYHQIAAYESLGVIADQAGFGAHRSWIERSVAEEREGAAAAEKLIASVTHEYLRHATAG